MQMNMHAECNRCTFERLYHYGLDGRGRLIHRPDLCDGFEPIQQTIVNTSLWDEKEKAA